jgi:predicted double-glycine peptidase
MNRSLLLAALLAWLPGAFAEGTSYFADLGGASVRLPVTSLKQAKIAGTVLQQYDFSCGSAALATLLTHHYGHPVAEQEVLQAMYAVGDREKIHREGFSLLDMKRYLAGLGYTADGFEQPLEKLAEARVPAVVLINEGGYRHFVVIKGLDQERVLFGDPARGTRAMPVREFKAAWIGGLLFVIHNRMDQARFNLRADWQVAPRAPLIAGRAHDAAAMNPLPRLGPGDF